MTKAKRGFTLVHNRSKFHEKRGFRLEQIRQKQAKGFGRTPSFRHDIGFRMRQMLYFWHFKPPSRANRRSCRTTKGYWVSDGHQWLADVAIYARKSEGFGFILRSFVLLNHRPPHQASHHATPDPSGGNAAVVRDRKGNAPVGLARHLAHYLFYPIPLPYLFE